MHWPGFGLRDRSECARPAPLAPVVTSQRSRPGLPLKDYVTLVLFGPAGRLPSLRCTHIREDVCVCTLTSVCLLLLYLGELLLQQPELGSGSYDISSRLIGAIQK